MEKGTYYPMLGLNVIRIENGQQMNFGEQVEGTNKNKKYVEGMEKWKELYADRGKDSSVLNKMKNLRINML